MPVVSTFFGILIRMFYREHGLPHFYVEHQGQQATFTFTFGGELLAGNIRSRTALRLIREWALATSTLARSRSDGYMNVTCALRMNRVD